MSRIEQKWETLCVRRGLRTLGARVIDVGAKALKVPRVENRGVIRASSTVGIDETVGMPGTDIAFELSPAHRRSRRRSPAG
jgi:hypothetical protein